MNTRDDLRKDIDLMFEAYLQSLEPKEIWTNEEADALLQSFFSVVNEIEDPLHTVYKLKGLGKSFKKS
jgi:hypothetical protein